jgi:hypothetical protein
MLMLPKVAIRFASGEVLLGRVPGVERAHSNSTELGTCGNHSEIVAGFANPWEWVSTPDGVL